MKTKSLLIVAASFGLLGAAHAEEKKKDRPERKLPPEVIEKFDTDGDGKLNEEERMAARAAHKGMSETRKKEILEKFDKDGDGELNEEERKAAKAARKQMMLEKFDKDGDGELSDEEKAAMQEEMKNHREPRDGEKKKHKAKKDA